MIGVLAYGLATTPSRIDDLILIWIILVIAAFVAINYLTWQIKGQENLLLTDKQIELCNSGTWFKRKIEIDYSEAENIYFDNDNETPWWIKFWGIGGGKVRIEYLGRKCRFGQDLTLEQAKSMSEKIKNEFDKRKTNANKNIVHLADGANNENFSSKYKLR